jgi:DNA-binding transcriptional MerR regulator
MRIGELAKATGLTVQTIRYYEARGLLPPHRRTEGGYRIFGPEDVERLRFIKRAQRLGLSLEEIREVLAIWSAKRPTCVHVRSLLEGRLQEVESLLEELLEFRAVIVSLLEQSATLEDCRPYGGQVCCIIEQAPASPTPRLQAGMWRAEPRNYRKAKAGTQYGPEWQRQSG